MRLYLLPMHVASGDRVWRMQYSCSAEHRVTAALTDITDIWLHSISKLVCACWSTVAENQFGAKSAFNMFVFVSKYVAIRANVCFSAWLAACLSVCLSHIHSLVLLAANVCDLCTFLKLTFPDRCLLGCCFYDCIPMQLDNQYWAGYGPVQESKLQCAWAY